MASIDGTITSADGLYFRGQGYRGPAQAGKRAPAPYVRTRTIKRTNSSVSGANAAGPIVVHHVTVGDTVSPPAGLAPGTQYTAMDTVTRQQRTGIAPATVVFRYRDAGAHSYVAIDHVCATCTHTITAIATGTYA